MKLATISTKRWWLLFLFAGAVCAHAAAAEKALGKAAKERATLYQQEVCTGLAEKHWHVTTNKVGRIVASHLLGPNQPGYDPLGYITLIVTFQPKSATDTECGINLLASIYGYAKGEAFHKTFSKPRPYNNPEAVEDIDTLLAKARQRLLTAHPEYAPVPAH